MADNKYLDFDGLKKVFGLVKGTTYTKTEVDGIVADMATKDWVGKEGFLKQANLADYAKTADVVAKKDVTFTPNTSAGTVNISVDGKSADVLTKHQDITGKADKTAAIGGASYNSATKKIVFTSVSGATIGNGIDCTDFIKDGMVNTVEVTDGTGDNNGKQVLKITFNSDAGKAAIEVPIEKIFNPSNYLTKTEVNTELAKKVDNSTYSTDKSATDGRIKTLEDWKTSHTTDYGTLNGKVTALENWKSTHTTEYGNLKSAVESLQSAAITWTPFTTAEIEQAYTTATASTPA